MYQFCAIHTADNTDDYLKKSIVSGKKSSSFTLVREVRLNLSFVAKNYLYFFPERCDHKK